MNVPAVLDALNHALTLQQRSTLQFTTAAGSMFGLEVQALTSHLWEFAEAELADTRLLVEKITALGGDPTTEVSPRRWTPDPYAAVDQLTPARTRRSPPCTPSSPTPARSRGRRRSST